MSVCANLKKFREKNGFTQKLLADFLGVEQGFISEVEKGERSLTADMIDRVSALFGVPAMAFGDEDIEALTFRCDTRMSDLFVDDLRTIATVNKIALNADFMAGLLAERSA